MKWSCLDLCSFKPAYLYQPHNTFHSLLKIIKIFICPLWMTEDTSTFWIWAISITEPCYARVLFQSCWNYLLYLAIHFYLCSLWNGSLTVSNYCSHSFTISCQISSKLAESAVEKNESPNKLGTCNIHAVLRAYTIYVWPLWGLKYNIHPWSTKNDTGQGGNYSELAKKTYNCILW
jgi:hypothetical protein